MNAPLYGKIIAQLIDDLASGKLKAGERLPTEQELADTFGVSRITSKRALDVLTQAGVVQRSRGRGSFVVKTLPNLDEVRRELSITDLRVASGTREAVGLILPDFSEVFGLAIVYAVEEACAKLGYHLILRRTYGEQRLEEEAIRALKEFGVSGLIVFPVHGEHYNPALLRAVLGNFPVVLIDRYLSGIRAPHVIIDNDKAAQTLTEYLLKLGHREIAFISPPVERTSTLEQRLAGFNTALSRHGIRANPTHSLNNLYSSLPTHFKPLDILYDQETIKTFLQSVPEVTAFVVVEYNLALALTQTLLSLGKNVPEDYSVVCFDSPEIPLEIPRFTHVRQDQSAMGAKAVEVLRDLIEGKESSLQHVMEFELVEGRSAGSARRLEVKT
jgi:GntR family transcriptional regulator, arabinose operon transcriptional repressor